GKGARLVPHRADRVRDPANLLGRRLAPHHDQHGYAAVSPRRTPTMVDTPGSCIVTPYTASALCMVRGLWVITMNWVECLNSSSRRVKRPTFASSSGASTSSMRQNGLGFVR